MKKILPLVLVSLVAAAPSFAAAPAEAKGKMLLDSSGARLAPVYRVESDGSAQIVFEGRMVTVPSATLSMVDGKLTTSLKKTDVIALR